MQVGEGLASGIIENTLKKINAKEKFIVWIGPHISQEFFEVGAEVRNIFLENDPASAEAFTNEANGKYFLSMLKVAKLKLHSSRCPKNIHYEELLHL